MCSSSFFQRSALPLALRYHLTKILPALHSHLMAVEAVPEVMQTCSAPHLPLGVALIVAVTTKINK